MPAEPWDYRSALLHAAGICRRRRCAGAIQYRNAASALTALNLLAVPGACERERIARGLRAVRLPGRFQIVPGEVEWILDVAHNEPAAAVLAAALRPRPVRGRTIAVAGMLADKDVAGRGARSSMRCIDHWLLAGIER